MKSKRADANKAAVKPMSVMDHLERMATDRVESLKRRHVIKHCNRLLRTEQEHELIDAHLAEACRILASRLLNGASKTIAAQRREDRALNRIAAAFFYVTKRYHK